MRCAKPKCKRPPVWRRKVWSWFHPQREQIPVIYFVCDKHDAEYFEVSFNKEASERVARDLMVRPILKKDLADGTSVNTT